MSEAMLRLYVSTTAWVQDKYNHRKDSGATAVEYGLLVGLIAVAIITVLIAIGPKLSGLFQQVSDGLDNVPAGGAAAGGGAIFLG